MSNKKNSSQFNKNIFIRLAYEQAKINLGSTSNNPSVGCIVEKNGSTISSGRTSVNGRPHAESNALNKKLDFKGSNLFVSLEPCSHYGKTPPCTTKIVKKGVNKVFFSINDYDKRSSNKAFKFLKRKKVKVEKNILRKFGKIFYYSYYLKQKKLPPLLDAKIAISKDFFTKDKKIKWITNIHSRKRAHLLRSKYDCIISTSSTINNDNSLLNCRIKGLEKKSPAVVIIDRKFKLKRNIKLLKKKDNRKIYLFVCKKDNRKTRYFKGKGVKVIFCESLKKGEDFKNIFLKLSKLGYSRLFLESGLKFLKFLIDCKLIYNLYVFQSDKYLKNKGLFNAKNLLQNKIKLKRKVKVNLLQDILYKVNLK